MRDMDTFRFTVLIKCLEPSEVLQGRIRIKFIESNNY